MATGTVKWFSDETGCGFISSDDDSGNLFAHYSSIDTHGFQTLMKGQKVKFDITEGIKGKEASNIQDAL